LKVGLGEGVRRPGLRLLRSGVPDLLLGLHDRRWNGSVQELHLIPGRQFGQTGLFRGCGRGLDGRQ